MRAMKDNDAIFKEIAKTYVDNLGEKVKLENETQHITLDTKMLDEKLEEKLKAEKLKVEEKVSVQKIKKFTKVFMPIAACLVIVCIWAVNQGTIKSVMNESEAPAMEAELEVAEAEEPAANLPEEELTTEEPVDEEPAVGEQIIPLPTLPENLNVISQEVVDGTSIYHLVDEQGNDITIEMKYDQIENQEISDMQEEQINGHTIYKKDAELQKRITFEREGIVYILVNDSDIDILSAVCEHIIS